MTFLDWFQSDAGFYALSIGTLLIYFGVCLLSYPRTDARDDHYTARRKGEHRAR